MRTLVWGLFFIFLAAGIADAANNNASQHDPVEITSTGETTYENGVATARDNVAIHIGDTDIYGDSAQYNSRTHEVSVEGHVRIYRELTMYVADRGVYNIETKQIRTDKVRTEFHPYFLSGRDVNETSANVYRVEGATFTTDDSPRPDFHLRARTVRVYENDHVVFQNVTFYVGRVPIFWWPYLYQSLNDAFSFSIAPADLSSWGPSLLTQVTFPITDDIKGRLRLDYRGRRGLAIGFDSDVDYGKDKSSHLKLKTYYLDDQNPDINPTALRRNDVPNDRYRLTLQDTTFFTDDVYATVNVTKLSDAFLMQDFYQSEFRIDPVPDNVIALTKSSPLYTLTAIARFQGNDFFETTERLPEIVLDVKRQPVFGTPVFYQGETGFADLHRSFAEGSGFENYGATRLDTFHQLLYPNTYLGWLSIVPRAGFRATYYDKTRNLGMSLFPDTGDPLIPNFILPDPTPLNPIVDAGSGTRTVFDTGTEASFKLSRSWEGIASRTWGLDGLLHVIQPYSDFSYVRENGINPAAVLEFDRFEPSTQARPIDFPQFTSIDSIASWTVWRNGVRNRLETRRDDLTVTWLELDTFFDVNFDNPYDRRGYSNLFNKLRFTPLPWASLSVDSQVPAFTSGFTEVNTSLTVQPTANLQLSAGHRYLNDNPFFEHSSLFVVGGYYRVTDNWGFGFQEQYEGTIGLFQEQRYAIYRDLTNWVASFGAVVRDNTGNKKEYGILLTFTLKAFPKFGFDLNFDPGSQGQ
ncbi:MAG TPA: LPS assembly protein LptD [Chthoniobacterales bacterium]|nr:LPS assembly protein LptD [Chthoniobacterales bacterium]